MQPRFPPQGSPRYFRYIEQKLLQHHVDIQRLWKRMPFFTSGGIGEPLTGFLPTADGPSGASNTGPGSMAATPGVGSDAPYTNQPPVYVSGVIDYYSNTPGSYRSVPDGPFSNTSHSGHGSGPRSNTNVSDGQGSGAGSGQGSGASGGTGLTLSGTPLSGTPLSGTPLSGTPLSGTPLSGTPLSGTPVSGGGGGGPSGTFQSNPATGCSGCTDGLAPRRYRVTFSGVTDNTCTDSANLNGSHIVTFEGEFLGDCTWGKTLTLCGDASAELDFTITSGGQWILNVRIDGDNRASYAGGGNCLQQQTLTQSSSTNYYNFPATITVEPA